MCAHICACMCVDKSKNKFQSEQCINTDFGKRLHILQKANARITFEIHQTTAYRNFALLLIQSGVTVIKL